MTTIPDSVPGLATADGTMTGAGSTESGRETDRRARPAFIFGGQVLDDHADVIELLTRDHHGLLELAEDLDREQEAGQLRTLFDLFVRQLAAHEAAEQQVVFPIYCGVVRAGDIETRRRTNEHEEINELLAEMRLLTPDDVGFEKRAAALTVELEAHFAAEEQHVFPQLRSSVSAGDLVALGDRVRAVKTTAPSFPEPVLTQHVHAEKRPKRSASTRALRGQLRAVVSDIQTDQRGTNDDKD